jgi:secreted trypsin-like serine protease
LSSLLMWLSAPNPPGGACDGDSGAPVFDADGRLAGVVAFAEGEAGQSCGKLTQAIRVAPFRSWIENTVEQWAR